MLVQDPRTPTPESLFGRAIQNRAGDFLAMVGGVAKEEFTEGDALEMKMEVVLPGEANAAMNLHAVVADLAPFVGAKGFGNRDSGAGVGRTRGQSPRGKQGRRAGALGVEQHVGALVLHGLKAADGLSKLLPCFGVFHRGFEDPLHRPNGFRADGDGGNLRCVFEGGAGRVADGQNLGTRDQDILDGHVVEFARGIKCRRGLDGHARRPAWNRNHCQVLPLANDEEDHVGYRGIEHESLQASELPGTVGLFEMDLNIFGIPAALRLQEGHGGFRCTFGD